ncbi:MULTISPECIES: hypothetical protein [unclassified Clostridium]|uniref:hypothetical protein n=1 Tax=unclassified Clostridium TaxID=2614128 RepID=UPI0002D3C35E|nr:MULTISPECIES: hypothetical protein [unclassified Clostridium]
MSAINEEELRHSKQFEGIYRDFTGMGIQTEGEENFEIPNSYSGGIKTALFYEVEML